MLKIGLAGQYADFIDHPDQVFDLHNRNEAELSREEFVLVSLPFGEEDEFDLGGQADAYIAGGLFYHVLGRYCTDAPLVGIHMMGCDLYHRVAELRKRFHSRRIGILAPRGMLLGAQYALDALPFEACLYELRAFSDRQPLLLQAMADGCDCILSDSQVCRLAEEAGLACMLLRPRTDSFYHSITAAKRAALGLVRGDGSATGRGIVLEHSFWHASAPRSPAPDGPPLSFRERPVREADWGSVLPFPQVAPDSRQEKGRLLKALKSVRYPGGKAASILQMRRYTLWYEMRQNELPKASL